MVALNSIRYIGMFIYCAGNKNEPVRCIAHTDEMRTTLYFVMFSLFDTVGSVGS